MMRLIDADARVIVQYFDVEHEEYCHTEMTVETALDFGTDEGCPPIIDAAPVVHGRWEHRFGDEWCCTMCGYVVHTDGSWEHPFTLGKKYCENCGAKMAEHPWVADGCGQAFSPD